MMTRLGMAVDCEGDGGKHGDVQRRLATRSRAVRHRAGVPTGAVGMLTEGRQVEAVLAEGDADAAFLARELLRDPHWPLRAALELGESIPWPVQYDRARPLLD